MTYIITISDLPGEFRAETAREAARKVRAFEMLGRRWAVRDRKGNVLDPAALDALAEMES